MCLRRHRKFTDLIAAAEQYPKIEPLQAMVEFFEKKPENSLDKLLGGTKNPDGYELLSIDIDSYDLTIWSAYEVAPRSSL